MTTKTDFHSIMELKENFKPKERGGVMDGVLNRLCKACAGEEK